MSNVNELLQGLSVEPLITLYEIDATKINGTIYRFTSTVDDNGTTADTIYFGGNEYIPIECWADGFNRSGKGQLPTPKFKIRNVAILTQMVVDNDDFLGAIFKRIRTLKRFVNSDIAEYFCLDIFKIERKSAHNKTFIEWELSCPLDNDGRSIPGRIAQNSYCPWIYRWWNGVDFEYDTSSRGCTWDKKIKYYDEKGNIVSDPSKDKCGKHLSDCILRFGKNNVIPFGGFPGMSRVKR